MGQSRGPCSFIKRSVTVFAAGAQTRKSQLSPARLAPSGVVMVMALLRMRVLTYVEKDAITPRMHPQNNSTLILASSSPRRQELLRQAGIAFQAHAAHINEDQIAGEDARDYAMRLSREKAQTVAAHYPRSYVLGADTIVVVDGGVLGKPKDHADAARTLRLLSARGHEVTTAVSLIVLDAVAPGTVAPGTVAP